MNYLNGITKTLKKLSNLPNLALRLFWTWLSHCAI